MKEKKSEKKKIIGGRNAGKNQAYAMVKTKLHRASDVRQNFFFVTKVDRDIVQ